jgi:hypothetical protein
LTESWKAGFNEAKQKNEAEAKKQTSGDNEQKSQDNPFGDQGPFFAFMATVATFSIIGYFLNDRYKEITWKTFVSTYLSQDRVQRIEIVNKKWARVILNPSEGAMELVCKLAAVR